MSGQLWLGFQMQEALSIQRGEKELKEKRIDEDFTNTGTPANEIQEFQSGWQVAPQLHMTEPSVISAHL